VSYFQERITLPSSLIPKRLVPQPFLQEFTLSDQNHQPYRLTLIATAGQPASALIVELRFAPELPAVGQPGEDPGDLFLVQRADGGHTLVVSLGKSKKYSPEMARRAGGGLGKWLAENGAKEAAINLDTLPEPGENAQALLEGLKLGAYRFDRYKQSDTPAPEITASVFGGAGQPANLALVERVEAVTKAVILARDLSHEPANVINPPSLAERARQVAEQSGLKIRVLDERQLAEMGAGAILAVGQGSQTPPRMIILEYPGQNPQADPVVLVGKAITFDTGGYSIKSVEGIVGMKYDKCGGVDVLAALQAAAALKLRPRVIGIIAAAENMISGQSYRPDDIITSLSGKTVEIISTDAEGRLVLADALTYAQREYHPRCIIDLATLTGGVVVALGHVRAGLISNNDALANQLFQAGEKTGERLWRLPLDEEYSKAMKGEDADLKNSGGREGHAILGGAFLKAFVADTVPWAHLDIAGVADTNKDLPYSPKGATGFGIRLLVDYLGTL
jgi:leucyl aminopeptidase